MRWSVMRRMTIPVALLVSLGIILLAAAILFAMGRVPICKCGYVRFWDATPTSQHLFDAYSFTHVLHGPIFYLLIWLIARGRLSVAARLVVAVVIEAAWELVENSSFIINAYRGGVSPDYSGDSIVNSVGDMAAMIVGFLITSRLRPWVAAILFVVAEVALSMTINDSLVLNFIGLVRSILGGV